MELRETPRAVTPFGGLVVFIEFLWQVGYPEAVSKHLPFRLTPPDAIDPVATFTAFLFSVVAGARRFAHARLVLHLSASWGGLQRRIPLLESVLSYEIPTSPKLHPKPAT